MKTSQAWWVVAGNFRLYCQSQRCVKEWISYIIERGGVPRVEPVR